MYLIILLFIILIFIIIKNKNKNKNKNKKGFNINYLTKQKIINIKKIIVEEDEYNIKIIKKYAWDELLVIVTHSHILYSIKHDLNNCNFVITYNNLLLIYFNNKIVIINNKKNKNNNDIYLNFFINNNNNNKYNEYKEYNLLNKFKKLYKEYNLLNKFKNILLINYVNRLIVVNINNINDIKIYASNFFSDNLNKIKVIYAPNYFKRVYKHNLDIIYYYNGTISIKNHLFGCIKNYKYNKLAVKIYYYSINNDSRFNIHYKNYNIFIFKVYFLNNNFYYLKNLNHKTLCIYI